MDERLRTILGHAEMRSLPMSPQWTLTSGGREYAKLRRFPSKHTSSVKLADDTVWNLVPGGWGTIRAMEGETEIARIIRRSWWGRRWEIDSIGFAVNLVSRPRPRHWSMTIGGQPIAEVYGSVFSYNRIRFDASLNIPVVAVVLAWQVIARPWEQAAHPIELLPGQVRSAIAS